LKNGIKKFAKYGIIELQKIDYTGFLKNGIINFLDGFYTGLLKNGIKKFAKYGIIELQKIDYTIFQKTGIINFLDGFYTGFLKNGIKKFAKYGIIELQKIDYTGFLKNGIIELSKKAVFKISYFVPTFFYDRQHPPTRSTKGY